MHHIAVLKNPIQSYSWGSETAIAQLLGRSVKGRARELELRQGTAAALPEIAKLGPRKGLVREQDVSFRNGVIGRTVATAPFARVQHVAIHRGPLDRRIESLERDFSPNVTFLGKHMHFDGAGKIVHENPPQPGHQFSFGSPAELMEVAVCLEHRFLNNVRGT